MNKVWRRIMVWALLIVVCIPGVALGEPPAKIFGVVLAILLIVWDYSASKKGKRRVSEAVKPVESEGLGKELKLSRKQSRKRRHAQLESKANWRFIKLAYFVLAATWFLVAILIESYDTYDETDTGVLVFFGVCALLVYPAFKRAAFYVYFGSSKAKSKQRPDIV